MKPTEFREQIVALITRFVKKWKPATLNIQCPLTIQEYRHPFWRQKKCGTCRKRNNVGNGDRVTVRGGKKYKCIPHPEIFVFLDHDACPEYED